MSVLDNSFDYSREVSSRAAWLDSASSNLLSDNSIFNSRIQQSEPAWLGAVDFYDSAYQNARVAEGEPTPEGEAPADGDPAAPEGETPPAPEGETPTAPEGESPTPEAETPAPPESETPAAPEGPAPPVPAGPPNNDADPKGGGENIPTNPSTGEGGQVIEGPPPPGVHSGPPPKTLPGAPDDAEEPGHTNSPFDADGMSVADIKRKAMEDALGEPGQHSPGRPSPVSDDAIPKTFGEIKRQQMEKRPDVDVQDWEEQIKQRLAELAKRKGLVGNPPAQQGGLGGTPGIAYAVPRDPNAPPPSGEQSEGTSKSGGRGGRG
ncbi:MAG: hypothetical protein C0507_15940 [Cyanobacteria bacterium PR.3.49]|nr:hypothetical protein [Cyanobacteria bacterium PR.3.49]